MARADVWFDGDAPRSDAESLFLSGVRDHRDDWIAAGLTPALTSTLAILVPLYLQVDLPGIPRRLVNLQVGFWHESPQGTGVEAEWGDSYLLDGGRPRGLDHFTSPAEPQEQAEVASRWLIEQLARPIEQSEWVSSSGDVVGQRWTFADTGELLSRTGAARRRRSRRPPDRVSRVR
ncbi:MAG: hypothetical protein AAGC49_10060 [Brevundimonas sp.]